MSESVAETAQWPDKFVYVCTAGRGASVNLAPMLHAGKRIKGVVILVPVVNQHRPQPNDISEAILPAERIEAYSRTSLELDASQIKRVYGHPDLVGSWTNALDEAETLAKDLSADIVFNITGGRKPATLGAILGIRSFSDTNVSLVTIGSSTSVVRLVQIRDGEISERPLPMPGELTLDTYLATYGYREIDRHKRDDWIEWVERHDPLMKQLQKMAHDSMRSAFAAINRRASQFDEFKLPVQLKLNPKASAALAPLTEFLDSTKIANDVLHVASADALRFLRGGWLEALVYKQINERIANRNSVSIIPNVFVGRADGQKAETEFDLAIVGDDRLDLIEVKAVIDPRGLQAAITKLAHYRTLLAGPGGRAWLVLPLTFYKQMEGAELVARAESEGVTLCIGRNAITKLVDQLSSRHYRRA